MHFPSRFRGKVSDTKHILVHFEVKRDTFQAIKHTTLYLSKNARHLAIILFGKLLSSLPCVGSLLTRCCTSSFSVSDILTRKARLSGTLILCGMPKYDGANQQVTVSSFRFQCRFIVDHPNNFVPVRGGSSPKILGGIAPQLLHHRVHFSVLRNLKIRTLYRPTFEIYHYSCQLG